MVLGSACYKKGEAFERKFIVLNEITFSYCIAGFFCFLKVILTIKLRGKTEKEEDRHWNRHKEHLSFPIILHTQKRNLKKLSPATIPP